MTHAKGIMPLLVAFLVLGWVFMNGGTSLQAATPAPVGNWRIISSPNPSSTENTLLGVATVSAKEVWAVGYYRDSNSNALKALIERWNGSRWKVIVHPDPSATSNFLFNVTAISVHNVWAVGRYIDSNAVQRTLILHWNGTAWRRIASPNASTSFNTLNSVAAISSNNIWAVGFSVDDASGMRKTLIEHWNGTTWRIVPSRNIAGRSNVLNSVAVVSQHNIWAVGDAANNQGEYVTLSEHWNGNVWSIVASPNPNPNFSHLYGVTALSAKNIWAVGFSTNTAGLWTTLVLHWSGHEWKVVPSPSPGTDSNVLNAVSAVSSNNIWAVGYLLNGGSTSLATHTLILHYNGSKWSVIRSPNRGGGSNYLADVTPVPTTATLWSVGYSYDVNHGNPQTLTEFYH